MVEHLGHVFADSGSVVVARYTGLTVAEMTDLRERMKAAGAQFKVVKNRLAKIALENTDRSFGCGYVRRSDRHRLCARTRSRPAKVATQFAKEKQKFIIVGGLVGKGAVNEDGIKALADMPSMDELRAKLVGVLNAPAGKLVRTLNAPGEKACPHAERARLRPRRCAAGPSGAAGSSVIQTWRHWQLQHSNGNKVKANV